MSTSTADRELVRRMESWGRTYALNRDMPPDNAAPPLDLQIERIVRRYAGSNPRNGVALRAYFCAAGRRDRERYKHAEEECRMRLMGELSKRQFYAGVRGGLSYVEYCLTLA